METREEKTEKHRETNRGQEQEIALLSNVKRIIAKNRIHRDEEDGKR